MQSSNRQGRPGKQAIETAETGNPGDQSSRSRRATWWVAGLAVVVLLWSYWPTLVDLWLFWNRNPDYSAGVLVPLVIGYALWQKRKWLIDTPKRIFWPGLGVVLLAQLARFFGILYMFGSVERYSFLLTIFGGVLFLLGPAAVRQLSWKFAFLLLMMPLPNSVHIRVSEPLQSFATSSAVFGLELLGYMVARQGHVILIGEGTRVAVEEACSGLRMMTAFVIIAGAFALVLNRPKWQRLVIVLSSLPVAIFTNSIRLIITAILFDALGSEFAEKFFHDFGGFAMVPFAFFLLIGELYLLRWLTSGEGRSPSNSLPRAAQSMS